MAKRSQRTAVAETEGGRSAPSAANNAASFLLFRIAEETFAFRLSNVAEIIRLPRLAHMPLGPKSLLGLANLRGGVLPIVSIGRLLNLPGAALSEETRVIVIDQGSPVGFAVDRIISLNAISESAVQRGDAGAGIIDPAFVDGVLAGAEGENSIKLLNPQRLLQHDFAVLGSASNRTSLKASSVASGPLCTAETEHNTSLVSFELGSQEYALPLADVREIISMPKHVAEVARSESAVLGVVTLRDRLLPLVSLRALLGLPADSETGSRAKVVVLSVGKAAVGVVTDRTREILHVDSRRIDVAPALLTRGEGDAEINSICRLEGGKRLVAILSPERLFRSDLVSRVLAEHGDASEVADAQEDEHGMVDEQFVVFRLGSQEYGIPVASIAEVARPPEHISKLPKAPAFIDGIINLRGSVVPVIDLARRFDIPAASVTATRRILVLAIAGVQTGLMVDGVSDITFVSESSLRPAPELSAEQMRLISRVANLTEQNRMILIVDAAKLLDQIEEDLLVKFGEDEAEKKSKEP